MTTRTLHTTTQLQYLVQGHRSSFWWCRCRLDAAIQSYYFVLYVIIKEKMQII